MKRFRGIAAFSGFLLISVGNTGAAPSAQIGDAYEITLTKDTSQQRPIGSGSSHDVDSIIERVISVHPDGLELEYDLPKSENGDARAQSWQFPVRVFKPVGGPAKLLNEPELEARADGWLKAAGLPRSACGHWYFTWNTFQVECDPQSAIRMVEAFDLRSIDVRNGASYQAPGASSPGTLTEQTSGPDGSVFVVNLLVDPESVRRERAQADFVVGEIMRKPVTFDEALQRHKSEDISGNITVKFKTNSAGELIRRTTVVEEKIKSSDGQSETNTITETLQRRPVPSFD